MPPTSRQSSASSASSGASPHPSPRHSPVMVGFGIVRKGSYTPAANTPPLVRRKSSVEAKTAATPPQPDIDILMSHIHLQQRASFLNGTSSASVGSGGRRRSPPQSPVLDTTKKFELAHGLTTIRSYRPPDLPTIKYYVFAQIRNHWYRIASGLATAPLMLGIYAMLLLPLLLVFGFTHWLILSILVLVPLVASVLRLYMIYFARFQNEIYLNESEIENVYFKNPRNHLWVATLNDDFHQPTAPAVADQGSATECWTKHSDWISSVTQQLHVLKSAANHLLTAYLFPLPTDESLFDTAQSQSFDIDSKSLPSQSIIGCIALTENDPKTCEIQRLFVHPTVRHHHIGSHLLLTAESFARSKQYDRALLTVMNVQRGAMKFFADHGYEKVSVRTDWRSGISSHIFTKKL